MSTPDIAAGTDVSVVVRHNFEMAHRLFAQGPGTKCWNLHGHSFWCEVWVTTDTLDGRGMVIEYGELKRAVRSYVDDQLDHGACLNVADPICTVLAEQGCKLLTLDHDPTVEALAAHLQRKVELMLPLLEHGDACWVSRVVVNETHVNSAVLTWTR